MKINEAVIQAMETNKHIKRRKNQYCKIKPTNFGECLCVIQCGCEERQLKPKGYWNPSADDLIAEDWEICD